MLKVYKKDSSIQTKTVGIQTNLNATKNVKKKYNLRIAWTTHSILYMIVYLYLIIYINTYIDYKHILVHTCTDLLYS